MHSRALSLTLILVAQASCGDATAPGRPAGNKPPVVRLAAWAFNSDYAAGVLLAPDLIAVNSDGGGRVHLASVASRNYPSVSPRWIPGTSTVIYTDFGADGATLWTVGEGQPPRRVFAAKPAGLDWVFDAAPSGDGKWIWFAGRGSACAGTCILRARIDGSGIELLTSVDAIEPSPAVSFDGSRGAFGVDGSNGMRFFDATTKTYTTGGIHGSMPAWSPRDDQVAAWDRDTGHYVIMNTAGSVTKTLPNSYQAFLRPSWSADGEWLGVLAGGTFRMLSVRDSMQVDYPASGFLAAVSVR